jgi:hypothetical protein
MTRHARTVSITNAKPMVAGALAAAALLLPWPAAPESTLQSGARTATVGATAHLDFRIVIPPVLALAVGPVSGPAGVAPRVAVASNTRQVLMTATAGEDLPASSRPAATGEPEPRPANPTASAAVARGEAHHAVLLTAGRGAVITAETTCQPAAPRVVPTPRKTQGPAILDRRPVVCTVAMP